MPTLPERAFTASIDLPPTAVIVDTGASGFVSTFGWAKAFLSCLSKWAVHFRPIEVNRGYTVANGGQTTVSTTYEIDRLRVSLDVVDPSYDAMKKWEMGNSRGSRPVALPYHVC